MQVLGTLTGIDKVFATRHSGLALANNGDLYCWGESGDVTIPGQTAICLGQTSNVTTPTMIASGIYDVMPAGTYVIAVDVGSYS